MKKTPKLLSILTYILLLACLLFLAAELFQGERPEQVSYSEMRTLFLEEKVKSFNWKNGTLTMELRKADKDGNKVVEHELADLDMFWEDLGKTIRQQQRDGILKEYNYEPVKGTPWYLQILPYAVLSVLLVVLLYVMLMRANNAAGGGAGAKFGRANAHLGTGGRKVTFDDVAGADEEKEELREIVDFLREPAKYRALGAKIPKGVLLVGPPGTGKTLLARAVAGEANVQFLSISGSDFVELYVGVGASRVRDLFDQAKKTAPAIIFIDEIDAVGRQRGAGLGGGHDEREQTLNQLLVEMDGFGSNEGVIVMAATNRQDILDPALLRPGRFDRQIYVNPPDVKGREAILHVHARNKRLGEDVDLKTVAQATGGFTGADLENLLNEAALAAAKQNLPVITMQTMEEAIMKVIAGPQKRSLVLLERDRRITAFHEAGHAIAAYRQPTQEPVQQITIVPRGNALGLTVQLPEEERQHQTRNQMREEIVTLLGGRVAEQLIFDDISTGASSDLQRASRLAHDMIARFGMSDRLGAVSFDQGGEVFVGRSYERTKAYSEQTGAIIDDEMKRAVDAAYRRCEEILRANDEKLREVAEFLLAHETMTRSQFEACMKGEPIPVQREGFFSHAQSAQEQAQKTARPEQDPTEQPSQNASDTAD